VRRDQRRRARFLIVREIVHGRRAFARGVDPQDDRDERDRDEHRGEEENAAAHGSSVEV
jgi:hypothetical protein